MSSTRRTGARSTRPATPSSTSIGPMISKRSKCGALPVDSPRTLTQDVGARTRIDRRIYGRESVAQIQAMWAKLDANERLVGYGAIIVFIASLLGIFSGGGV